MSSLGRFPFYISAVVAIGLVLWLGMAALPLLLVPVAIAWLYRDPDRQIPSAPLGIVSPTDGVVTAVIDSFDRLLNREAVCIRIKLAIWGTFSIRSVTEGKVCQHRLNSTEMNQGHDASARPAHAIWVQTDEGDDVVMVIRPGLVGGLHCRTAVGERIGQGQRCCFLLFARYIDVYLPRVSTIAVASGNRVIAGETIIAQLIHR